LSALVLSAPPAFAESAYETAAKLDMEHLASSVLAASLCEGARFNSDTVITSVTAVMVLLGRKRTEETFFSAMRANVDTLSSIGRAAWCAATLKAAKERNSDMLTFGNGGDENK
jgi:hypothetical protein